VTPCSRARAGHGRLDHDATRRGALPHRRLRLLAIVAYAVVSEYLAQEGVRIRNVTDHYGGLALIGPHSRQLLARIAHTEIPDSASRSWRNSNGHRLYPGDRRAASVSGELGYEIYVPTLHISALLDAVLVASIGLGARHIGMYALNSCG